MPSDECRIRLLILVSLALLMVASGCKSPEPLSIPVREFQVRVLSLPETWREDASTRDDPTQIATEQWQQRWTPEDISELDSPPSPDLGFCIRRYETVDQARDEYRLTLRRLRDSQYTGGPYLNWDEVDSHADQYEIVCSPPDTMGEGCVAVGRYTNYVTLVGLDPGDGLSMSSAPELFEDIDRQVRQVIEAHLIH